MASSSLDFISRGSSRALDLSICTSERRSLIFFSSLPLKNTTHEVDLTDRKIENLSGELEWKSMGKDKRFDFSCLWKDKDADDADVLYLEVVGLPLEP